MAVLLFFDPTVEASQKVEDRLRRVALKYTDRAAFGSLDVNANPHVARAVGVRAVPEVLVFVNGASADRLMGVAPESIIEDAVRARVAPRPAPADEE